MSNKLLVRNYYIDDIFWNIIVYNKKNNKNTLKMKEYVGILNRKGTGTRLELYLSNKIKHLFHITTIHSCKYRSCVLCMLLL